MRSAPNAIVAVFRVIDLALVILLGAFMIALRAAVVLSFLPVLLMPGYVVAILLFRTLPALEAIFQRAAALAGISDPHLLAAVVVVVLLAIALSVFLAQAAYLELRAREADSARAYKVCRYAFEALAPEGTVPADYAFANASNVVAACVHRAQAASDAALAALVADGASEAYHAAAYAHAETYAAAYSAPEDEDFFACEAARDSAQEAANAAAYRAASGYRGVDAESARTYAVWHADLAMKVVEARTVADAVAAMHSSMAALSKESWRHREGAPELLQAIEYVAIAEKSVRDAEELSIEAQRLRLHEGRYPSPEAATR